MEDLKTNLVGDVSTIAGVAARRGRTGLVDRVRQCVESADRARHQPASGAGGSRRARRVAQPHHSLPARRERLLALRRLSMALGSLVTWGGIQLLHTSARPISRAPRDTHRWRRDLAVLAAWRRRARCCSASSRPSTPREKVERSCAPLEPLVDRRRGGAAVATGAGRRAVRHSDAAARRRWTVARQPQRTASTSISASAAAGS